MLRGLMCMRQQCCRDGAASQNTQTLEINITSLPEWSEFKSSKIDS